MSFFTKLSPGPCQLVAMQMALSFFNIYPSRQELKKNLPKHTFGNFITELAVYLEQHNISTQLFSNLVPFKSKNKMFLQSLAEYKKYGSFVEKIPQQVDIKEKIAIVNVDFNKIKKINKKAVAHYVVARQESTRFYLYDRNNYKRKVKRSFEQLLAVSQQINRYHENGMWLLLEKISLES